jgi:RNA polymerase sigma factor (sigma-70 family)
MGSRVPPPSPLFEQLLRQVGKTRLLARSLLGDESAAEDAIQETWASASRRPLPQAPEPWLKVALRNRLLNRAREERRRAAREEETAPAAPPDSPEELMARLEIHKKLVEAVARLDEPYRQTVLLRYFEELSSAEIGARLGVPAATVRGRLKTGLALLRNDLDRGPGGRKAWVGTMVLLAGGGRLGIQGVALIAKSASQGSAMIVKLMVALTAACGVGAVVVATRHRPPPAPMARVAPLPPVRLARLSSTPPERADPQPVAPAVGSAAAPAVSAVAAAPVTFALAGWVQLGDARPPLARIDTSREPSCPPLRDEGVLALNDGSLANVVVRLVGPVPAVAPPPSPLVLEQRSCEYQPRILVAQLGQTIELRSTDQVLHRAHGYAGGDTVLSGPLSMGTPPLTIPAPRAGETVRIGCDLHPWMTATIVGTDNPWHAVTDRGGRFAVGGLPAGAYTVEAWHERFGSQRTRFSVGPNHQVAVVNFVFGKGWPLPGAATSKSDESPGGDRCRIAGKGDSPVARACREGGIKRAKATMKQLQKLGKARGLKLECDECHKDESAGNWTLAEGAAEKFNKLLAAVSEAGDSAHPR